MLVGSVGWIQYGTALTANPPWTLNYPLPSSTSFSVAQYANGTYYAVSGDGQTYTSSASGYTVLQYAINALDATNGGTITVIPPFVSTGVIQITGSHVAIVAGGYGNDAVDIQSIAINATTTYPYGTVLQGFYTHQIMLYAAPTYGMGDIIIRDLTIDPSNAADEKGLVINRAANSAWIDGIRITTTKFLLTGTPTLNYGAINIIGYGSGDISLNQCSVSFSSGDSWKFISLAQDTSCEVRITNFHLYVNAGTNSTFMYVPANTGSYNGIMGLTVTNALFEIHQNITLIDIGAASAAQACSAQFNDIEYDGAGGNFTLLNNQNTNWLAWHNHVIFGGAIMNSEGYNCVVNGTWNTDANFAVQENIFGV